VERDKEGKRDCRTILARPTKISLSQLNLILKNKRVEPDEPEFLNEIGLNKLSEALTLWKEIFLIIKKIIEKMINIFQRENL